MAENKQTFLLDLDIKEFSEKALSAKGIIEKLGSAENVEGLISGLVDLSKKIAVVSVAAYALKVGFEAVFEAERIQKVNNLFEDLTKQIGLSADVLKNDLLKATGGLADDTEVLQAANKAIITMGESAKDLGRVMDISRRLTVAFGGDLVERFESINMAISSGSTRMLKANGIMIDADKAVKDYAKSLGVSKDSLTEAGRRQAVLNEVLKYGETRLKNLKGEVNDATGTWQQFKVTVGNIAETLTLAFERIAGPTARGLLKDLATVARQAGEALKASLGSGAEQAEAKVVLLNQQLEATNKQIEILEAERQKALAAGGGVGWLESIFGGPDYEKRLQKLRDDAEKTQVELEEIHKRQQRAAMGAGEEAAPEKETGFDPIKNLEARARFENDILKIKEQNNKAAIEMAQSTEELEKLQEEQRLLAYQDWSNRKAQLDLDYQSGKITSKAQYDAMSSEMDEAYYNNLRRLQEEELAQAERMEQNRLNASRNASEGIARAAEASAAQANRSLTNFGKQGMLVMDTIKNRGSDAFVAFGRAAVDHSQSASQIMKGFFLNSLADIAEAQGKLYLAAGLVDPTKLAAGAALLALSGVLRAMAGSAGGGGIGEGGGGGGGAYGAIGGAERPEVKEAPQKTVSVNIMGHYMESEHTKTWLMDQIRAATDATDFSYKQIGQA